MYWYHQSDTAAKLSSQQNRQSTGAVSSLSEPEQRSTVRSRLVITWCLRTVREVLLPVRDISEVGTMGSRVSVCGHAENGPPYQ